MKKLIDDGGPAFPCEMTGAKVSEQVSEQLFKFSGSFPGMSLRDWFAGQALAGQLASMSTAAGVAGIRQEEAPRWCAQSAYMFADAMIARKEAQ